jgi:sialic acid synthase SpsE
VAEIGVNHDGEVARAVEMVRAAAAAGFDAVKLQHWRLDELLAPGAPAAGYQRAPDQRSLLEPLALTIDELHAVRTEANAAGVAFLCTADGPRALGEVLRLDPVAVKIGSGDADNPWMLEAAAASRRPVLVSVGMSDDDEVLAAAGLLAAVPDVVFLHCVSAYPTALPDAALGRIPHLRALTGRPVGWSDHTLGYAAACAAVALGAVVVEVHVTLDPGAPGPDHAASLPLADAGDWIAAVRGVAAAMRPGSASPAEAQNRPVVRKGLHAARALAAGRVLSVADLVALRPLADALPVGSRDRVIGRRLLRARPALAPIRAEDLDPASPSDRGGTPG